MTHCQPTISYANWKLSINGNSCTGCGSDSGAHTCGNCNNTCNGRGLNDYLADGNIINTEYLTKVVMTYFRLKGTDIIPYPIKFNYIFKKGKIVIIDKQCSQYYKVDINSSLYTLITDGIFFATEVPFSLCLYKKNLEIFRQKNNSFITMASTYFINTNTVNTQKLNKIWKQRIGFNTNDYNFYTSDFYYDYYTTHNGYAYDCIRIIAQKVFLWHLVYNLANSYGIKIDFLFYLTFFTCIFESLYGTTPILSKQINLYFNKYHPDFMPESYDSIITKWVNIINLETDGVKILIFKQASYALSIQELENVDITKLFETFSYMIVKFKFLSCLTVSKTPPPVPPKKSIK